MSLRPKQALLDECEGSDPYKVVLVEILVDIRDVLAAISKRMGSTSSPPPPKVGGA